MHTALGRVVTEPVAQTPRTPQSVSSVCTAPLPPAPRDCTGGVESRGGPTGSGARNCTGITATMPPDFFLLKRRHFLPAEGSRPPVLFCRHLPVPVRLLSISDALREQEGARLPVQESIQPSSFSEINSEAVVPLCAVTPLLRFEIPSSLSPPAGNRSCTLDIFRVRSTVLTGTAARVRYFEEAKNGEVPAIWRKPVTLRCCQLTCSCFGVAVKVCSY